MKVTYLKHSGFMVESRNYIYLFDYIGGNIDKAIKSDKKIYVMVSHVHDDHFSKIIFDIATKHNNVTYVLSYDVVKKIKKNAILSKMTEQLNIIRVQAHEKYKIDDIVVETLKSTDEGVAFIVSEKDGTIYHAGDLNWWHWEAADTQHPCQSHAPGTCTQNANFFLRHVRVLRVCTAQRALHPLR